VTVELSTVSVVISQSLKIIPHNISQRAVEIAVTSETEISTAPESERGGWPSLLSWNVNTLTVFVILPITLSVAVFVSLIAVNYILYRGKDHRTQHDIQEKLNRFTAPFSEVPLLKTQLTPDITKQHAECENRSCYSVGSTDYHVYERID